MKSYFAYSSNLNGEEFEKIAQDKIILAWCYFKEESLNLGIIKIME